MDVTVKLTAQQGGVMDYLGRREYRDEPAPLREMAVALDAPPNGLSSTLASLVRLGLAQRIRGRGPVRYELTSQGLAVQGYRESTRRWKAMRGGS